jgi:predicted SAM-dependent methyltransferase
MALVEKVTGEVDHCRHRLMKYCRGQGLDLGCGNSKIRTDAIGVDLYSPMADMNFDAQLLKQYSDEFFDYIFSSHLIEEIEDTESTLREWLRVIKKDGNLVLYQADKDLYFPIGNPNCNPRHKHHFSWESLWEILKRIGGVKLIHHYQNPNKSEWSFELVVKKTTDDREPAMTGEGISILVPTLNRPQNMEKLAISINDTTKFHENVEIIFGIQEDEKSFQKALELQKICKISVRPEPIQRFLNGKINLSFLWNQLYAKASFPIMGYFGDDVIFHTPGWDEEIRHEFEVDKAVLVCCNDVHVQRGRVATLFFTHKAVHEKFGFYLDDRFQRWYMDTYWDRVYRNAGKLHYREDLIMEHLHPTKFPEKIDATYQSIEAFKDEDGRLWNSSAVQNDLNKKAMELKNFKI